MAKRNAQIKQLKSSIKTVINLAEDAKRRTQANASKQQDEDQKTNDAVAHKLSENIATLSKSLQEKVTSNREKEQVLRKVRERGCGVSPTLSARNPPFEYTQHVHVCVHIAIGTPFRNGEVYEYTCMIPNTQRQPVTQSVPESDMS